MNIFLRRFKLLISVSLIALLWWLLLRRHSKSTCDHQFTSVDKHIVRNAFDNRETSFIGVWASASSLEKEACSYFAIHRMKDSIMMGYKKPFGEYFHQYFGFSTGPDGIIRYYSEHDPAIVLGYIYPLFLDDYALGHVECTERNGFVEWKALIAVPIPLIPNLRAHSIVGQGIKTFQRVGSQLGVDIHVGDFYDKPCWKPPVWGLGVVHNETGH